MNKNAKQYEQVMKTVEKEKESVLEKIVENDSIPKLSKFRLSSNNCAGYVRMAAKKSFDKTYHERDSWDFRYNDSIVYEIKNKKDPYSHQNHQHNQIHFFYNSLIFLVVLHQLGYLSPYD